MKRPGLFFGFILIVFTVFLNCCEKDEEEDILPPVCNIVMPTDSCEFQIGDTININVEATDPDGLINAVLFYIDDLGKFSTKVLPYQFKWSTLNETVGFHIIRATAIDRGGNSSSDECIIKFIIGQPVVITASVSSVTNNSAVSGGNVTNDGGATVTARGVCWSTSSNPTISDYITNDGSGKGLFISSITGLESRTTYYVKAYATNSLGTSYGYQVSFKTNADLPTVITTSASSITTSSAQSGGNVTDDGGASVTAKGVCWSTSSNPTISDYITNDGSGKGSFNSSITGLESGTTYYVRAYSTNSEGIAYGDQKSFSTYDITGTFTDSRDGQIYDWVWIGNQLWMAENLAYLPAVSPPTEGSIDSPYYYVYDYEGTSVSSAKATANYITYGVLYNWYAVMNGAGGSSSNPSGVQGVCPSGWHLPSQAEIFELTDYLGGESVAGGKLKEAGFDHWQTPNTDATDETGFTALPGGGLNGNGVFHHVGSGGYWWSATESHSNHPWYHSMYYNYSGVGRSYGSKLPGFSVRCLRD